MRRLVGGFVLAVVLAAGATSPQWSLAGSRSPRPKHLPRPAVVAQDALTMALRTGRLSEAGYALERARSIFDLHLVRSAYGYVERPAGRAATMILRDLVAHLDRLQPQDQEVAGGLLARPDAGVGATQGFPRYQTESEVHCFDNFCLHWVESTADAPRLDDADADGIPDQVELTNAVLEEVRWIEVVRMGYRSPKGDGTSPNGGPDGRMDVYLMDVGADRMYGYCATDDPAATPGTGFYDVSAYCVLDNDYAVSQYPNSSPFDNLRVTAAHEYFHAVQFAYDFLEDSWLMEGTATWIEDEVYDSADDNQQFLKASALRSPGRPVDFGQKGFPYGAWLFWRFLTEYAGNHGAGIIRQVWERADASAGGPDDYSLQAAVNVLNRRDTRFRFAFADFAVWNSAAGRFYEEGGHYAQRAGRPYSRSTTLGSWKRAASGSATLDHLSSAYVSFWRGAGLSPRARLRIKLNLPDYARGPEASAVITSVSGALSVIPARLDASGADTIRAGFGATVRKITLILNNASVAFDDCFSGASAYSCTGVPEDDNLPFKYSVSVIR